MRQHEGTIVVVHHAADVREIVPDAERHFQALRRVEYQLPQPGQTWSWPRVAEEMRTDSQGMAVVNTKQDALDLLAAIADPTALHLSTLMCGVHRAETLREVRERLARGQPCRLVATQVVEAGVDLDFPLVLHAVGPLDRIVQAAGRCNREGKREQGRVVVFAPTEGHCPPGSYRTGTDVAAGLLAQQCDLHDPATYELYFERLFDAVDTDANGIQKLRQRLDYPETAKTFRLIEDDTIPVVVTHRDTK